MPWAGLGGDHNAIGDYSAVCFLDGNSACLEDNCRDSILNVAKNDKDYGPVLFSRCLATYRNTSYSRSQYMSLPGALVHGPVSLSAA